MYQFMINLHPYKWPIENKTQLLLQIKREEINMLNTKNEIISENDFGLVCVYYTQIQFWNTSNRRILITVILYCTIFTLIIPDNYLLAVQIDKIHWKLIDFGKKNDECLSRTR